MRNETPHLSNPELLLAADGDLPQDRKTDLESHLASCATCRARLNQMQATLADFAAAREALTPPLPSSAAAHASLASRLTASKTPSFGWIAAAVLALAIVTYSLFPVSLSPRIARRDIAARPDPRITPGAAVAMTRAQVCAAESVESPRVIPASLARQVFAAYGINQPEPRAYEVDYLISPALGGSDNLRNFWPQPYSDTIWNAHVKDALEDHLSRLVCDGQLDLVTAQREIARDWIGAYQKYFHTDRPIPQHLSFLKDRPWE